MSRPPAAREKVLDAFVAIVAEHGEQSATLDAVAAQAGVSKGGLLYHFGSREALVEGMLDALAAYGRSDVEAMRAAPEGPVAFYLRTSADLTEAPFNTYYVAASRLSGAAADQARAVLSEMEAQWYAALFEAVGDAALARTMLLIGDGLYLKAIRGQQEEATAQWREVAPVVDRILGDQRGTAD